MRYLVNRERFLESDLLLERVNVVKFCLSENMVGLLEGVRHEIAEELLALHRSRAKQKWQKLSFVDIHPTRPDYVTFILSPKIADVVKNTTGWEPKEGDEDPEIKSSIIPPTTMAKMRRNGSPMWTDTRRAEMPVGRFVRRVFEDRFPASKATGDNPKKPNDIESFVAAFVAAKSSWKGGFELVQGNDIMHWYSGERYVDGDGTLNHSCMKDDPPYMIMYAQNPDVCRMLILKDEKNPARICGRALVWRITKMDGQPSDRIFLDRVYTVNERDVVRFVKYAETEGWIYRQRQTFGGDAGITDPRAGNTANHKMLVKLRNDIEWYDNYPYVDTLSTYHPEHKVISNYSGTRLKNDLGVQNLGRSYDLTYTDGGPNRNEDADDWGDEEVHSDFHGQDIPRHEARFCEIGQDWVYTADAVYVNNAQGRYAVPGHPDIIHSEFANRWFLRTRPDGTPNVVWSDFHKSWIYYVSSRTVWTNVERTGSVIMHKYVAAEPPNNPRLRGEGGDDDHRHYEPGFVILSGQNERGNDMLYTLGLCHRDKSGPNGWVLNTPPEGSQKSPKTKVVAP